MVLKDGINSDILIKLYKIYDSHRDAILWFLEELDIDSYDEYIQKYGGSSIQRSYFIAVCGFFELSGVIISHKMIDPDIYFDMFNNKRLGWTKKREHDKKKFSHNIK